MIRYTSHDRSHDNKMCHVTGSLCLGQASILPGTPPRGCRCTGMPAPVSESHQYCGRPRGAGMNGGNTEFCKYWGGGGGGGGMGTSPGMYRIQ